jgi:hypothetical protein
MFTRIGLDANCAENGASRNAPAAPAILPLDAPRIAPHLESPDGEVRVAPLSRLRV